MNNVSTIECPVSIFLHHYKKNRLTTTITLPVVPDLARIRNFNKMGEGASEDLAFIAGGRGMAMHAYV